MGKNDLNFGRAERNFVRVLMLAGLFLPLMLLKYMNFLKISSERYPIDL